MKYLKNKKDRRRGAAIELAVSLLLIMTAMSTILIATTMIQLNKQKQSVNDLNDVVSEYEKIEYDQIGIYFEQLVKKEVEEINNDNEDLPIYVNENYISNKETFLEDRLNAKFKYFIKDKGFDFVVRIQMKITQIDSKDDMKNENMNIIQTHIENYNYEIVYTLFIRKYSKISFESEYKVNFKRTITQVSTQETIKEYLDKYYWYEDFSSTNENLEELTYLFFVQDGCEFYVYNSLGNPVDIKIYGENENINSVRLDNGNGYIISYETSPEDDISCIFTLTYLVESNDEEVEGIDDEVLGDEQNPEPQEPTEKTLYFKVLITRGEEPTQPDIDQDLDSDLITDGKNNQVIDPEEKEPATEENFDVVVSVFTGNYIPKPETQPTLNVSYEVTEKVLNKLKWENK